MKELYRIADLTVAMNSFGKTKKQAEPYKTSNLQETDIEISSEWPALRKRYASISDDEWEYLATGKSFYKQLLDFNGIMLHSSAVVMDEKAYLFTASSGTGKSTHTALWLKQFGSHAYILNDDKPALRYVDGTWFAYGTPWSGKCDLSVNKAVPLAGIAVLERGEINEIERFSGKDAVFEIYKQVNRKTETAEFRIKLLDVLDKLLTVVPVWKLKCNMDDEAAIISYEAMSGKTWR